VGADATRPSGGADAPCSRPTGPADGAGRRASGPDPAAEYPFQPRASGPRLRRRRALGAAPRPAGPGGPPPLAGRRRRPREAGRPDRRHARPVARPHPGRAARRLRRPAGPDAVATELKRGLAARSFAPQVGTDGASALKQRAPAGRTLAPLKSAQAASARGASDSAYQEGHPMLKVAIQMDPLEAVNVESDTTFLMALTGQARGHKLWVYDFR